MIMSSLADRMTLMTYCDVSLRGNVIVTMVLWADARIKRSLSISHVVAHKTRKALLTVVDSTLDRDHLSL